MANKQIRNSKSASKTICVEDTKTAYSRTVIKCLLVDFSAIIRLSKHIAAANRDSITSPFKSARLLVLPLEKSTFFYVSVMQFCYSVGNSGRPKNGGITHCSRSWLFSGPPTSDFIVLGMN